MKIGFLLLVAAWDLFATGNTCTLKNGGTACAGSGPAVCSMNGIAGDSSHSYFTGTNCTGNGYTPSADYLVVPTAFQLNFDQPGGTIVGDNGAPVYSYVKSITISGSTCTGTPTVTLTQGSATAWPNGGWTTYPHITPVMVGGTLSSAFMDVTTGPYRPWFTGASASPTVTVASCTAGSATGGVNLVAGGGTPAISISGLNAASTAAIIVTTSLTLKGDIAIAETAYVSITDDIIFNAGATLTWDSSGSSDGFSGNYIYGIVPAVNYNGFGSGAWSLNASACTAGSPCTITSNQSGAPPAMFNPGATAGWQINATHVAFSYLGSALDPAFVSYQYGENTTITNSTIDHSGIVWIQGNSGSQVTSIHGNKFTNPQSLGDLFYNNLTANSTGSRNVSNNVFSTCVGNGQALTATTDPSQMGCGANSAQQNSSVTMNGNWFPVMPDPNGLASFSNNFVQDPTSNFAIAPTTRSGNYWFTNQITSNPHFVPAGTFTAQNEISDIAEDITAGDASNFIPLAALSSGSGTLQNLIALPSKQGHGNGWITPFLDGGWASGSSVTVNHNTWWGRAATAGTGGNSLFAYTHNVDCAGVGTLTALKSNLIYGLGGSNKTFKAGAIVTASACLDQITSSNTDYNSAYNFTLTATCTGCNPSGGGNGYLTNTTAGVLPGVHDIDVVLNPGSAVGINPSFADPIRNLYLWDGKYLKNAVASAWATSTSYTPGNEVSDSHVGVYSGATVNYNCIASHTSNAQTEPDGTPLSYAGGGITNVVVSSGVATATFAASHQLSVDMHVNIYWAAAQSSNSGYNIITSVPTGTTLTFPATTLAGGTVSNGTYTTGIEIWIWRNFWEPASLTDLRNAIVAGTTYTDSSIGCGSGCVAPQALTNWVREGFTPQNPVLWCSGHDGEAVGAVPFCAKGKAMVGAIQ